MGRSPQFSKSFHVSRTVVSLSISIACTKHKALNLFKLAIQEDWVKLMYLGNSDHVCTLRLTCVQVIKSTPKTTRLPNQPWWWFHPIYCLCYRVFCVISLQPTVGLASSCMGWEIAGMQRGNSCFPFLSVRVLYAHVSCHGQPLIHYGISLLIMLVSVYVCEVTHCLHRLPALLSYCCSCLHKGWLAACWDSREKLACTSMSSSEGHSLSSFK